MLLEYDRIRRDAKPPTRGHPSDAGLDVYYCPESMEFGTIEMAPGQSMLFATGLRFGIPHGYMLEVKNRSSMASKRSLIVGARVIDSGYDGEVFINLHNIVCISAAKHIPHSPKNKWQDNYTNKNPSKFCFCKIS